MSSEAITAGPNPAGLCMCGCGAKAPIAKRTRRYLGQVKGQPCRFVSGHPSVKVTRRSVEEQRAASRATARRYRERHPGRAYEISKRHLRPEQHRAHQALGYAIKTGKVVREPCEVCGAEPAEGHHEDYSKPLEVRWLCPVHHRATPHP